MLYSEFIAEQRAEVGDDPRVMHVDWVGNGSDTVFQCPLDTYPIYDVSGTYVVKIAGTTKTEGSDFTLDKQTGTLVFTVAPTNGVAVTLDHKAVYLTNASWLKITNNTIKSLGNDFFKEFTDTSNFTTTAGALTLSLVASQPRCIAVYDFAYRQSTVNDWISVETFTNWRYDQDNNIIYVGGIEAFPVTGELLKIRGLRTFDLGDAISDTIDVQDRFMTIIQYGTNARYWEHRYRDVVELVSKNTMEASRTPLQDLMMLVDRFTRKYETEKAKLKPTKPAKIIPSFLNGSARP